MTRITRRLGAIAACAAVLTAPAAAAGAPRWTDEGPAASPVATDGARYAAWSLVGGGARVVDTVRRRAWTVTTPPGFVVAGLGAGKLLLRAPRGVSLVEDARLLDLRSGASFAPAGFDAYRAAAQCGRAVRRSCSRGSERVRWAACARTAPRTGGPLRVPDPLRLAHRRSPDGADAGAVADGRGGPRPRRDDPPSLHAAGTGAGRPADRAVRRPLPRLRLRRP